MIQVIGLFLSSLLAVLIGWGIYIHDKKNNNIHHAKWLFNVSFCISLFSSMYSLYSVIEIIPSQYAGVINTFGIIFNIIALLVEIWLI